MLSVGSIVYLKNGAMKMVVLGHCPIREGKYYDYLGGEFPIGINPEKLYFFNGDNIEEVIFEGYQDETNQKYLAAIDNWKQEFDVPKGDVLEALKNQQQKIIEEQEAKSNKENADELRNKLFNKR